MFIKLFRVATKLDWSGWLRGIFSAVISGGAGAISAGFGVTVIDPNKDFSGPNGYGRLFDLMLFCFLFSGVISLAKYLQANPIPPVIVQSSGSGDVNISVSKE